MTKAAFLLPGALLIAPGAATGTGFPDRPCIANQVARAVFALPNSGVFDHLSFRLDDNSVTLTGQVTWPALRDEAERSVRAVLGTVRIINEIEVLPLSPEDDRVRLAAFRAIYGDPALARYCFERGPAIRIIVENGAITLQGAVDNETARDLAASRARPLPGVLSVTNNLVVSRATNQRRSRAQAPRLPSASPGSIPATRQGAR